MGDKPDVVKGDDVSQEEKAEFNSLRSIFDPKASIDRLDSYAKWLFASAAIVGSLGAGLSNSALSKLRGLGVWLFAFSVVSLGVCLLLASRSIAPHWIEARTSVLASLRAAVASQFKQRRGQLAEAAFFFAMAIFLAALSPVVSLLATKHPPTLHYSIDDKGNLDAGLEATGVKEGTELEIRVEALTNPRTALVKAGATAGENDDVKLSIKMPAFNSMATGADLVSCSKPPSETSCTEMQRLPLRR